MRAIGLNVFLSLILAFFINLAVSYATLPVSKFPSLVHWQHDSCIHKFLKDLEFELSIKCKLKDLNDYLESHIGTKDFIVFFLFFADQKIICVIQWFLSFKWWIIDGILCLYIVITLVCVINDVYVVLQRFESEMSVGGSFVQDIQGWFTLVILM